MIRSTRRQLLAGAGLLAGSLFLPSRRARAQAGGPPKRLIIMFTQHGTVYGNWKMRAPGAGDNDPFSLDLAGLAETDMSEILRPLYAHRNKLLVVDGLSMASAEGDTLGNGHDIGTRHALTGAFLQGGSGGGPSVDQIVAQHIRQAGRIDSLEIGSAANGGAVWRDAGQSIPPDGEPDSIFDRVFPPQVGAGDPSNADRIRGAQGSVLDLVRAEYEALAPRLALEDRQKLELHRDLVRGVELRLEELRNVQCERPQEPALDGSSSTAFFESYSDAMFNMVAAAVACDLTRVVTIQVGQLDNEVIGAPPGDVHADFAHLQEVDEGARQMMTSYGRVHARQFARLLSLLDAIPEGNGTVLDNCAVVWCSELADGVHNFRPWPAVVAGGALRGGRYVNLPRTTPNPSTATSWPNYEPLIGPPHNRFWVSVAQGVGAPVTTVGEPELFTPEGVRVSCDGPLEELA